MATIAIPAERTEEGEYVAAAHFGRCPFFVVATIENGETTYKEVFANPHYEAHMPFAVPDFLASLTPRPDAVLTSGMGPRAVDALNESGIEAIVGVSGNVDDIIEKYKNGEIVAGDNICEHV